MFFIFTDYKSLKIYFPVYFSVHSVDHFITRIHLNFRYLQELKYFCPEQSQGGHGIVPCGTKCFPICLLAGMN